MHFIRLIRPINLVIIALTMIGIVVFFTQHMHLVQYDLVDFSLLVVSTLMIAAGGNIINDYFDVRADRINKPEKLIISKHIKRRWAIVTHWSFNTLASITALYLGWKYQSFAFPIIHISSITILWWYSVQLKKKALVGNIIVSCLTSLVILLTVIFLGLQTPKPYDTLMTSLSTDYVHLNAKDIIIYFILFSFVLNSAREIIKDVEDIKGDARINARTLPMVIGIRRSKLIVGCILFILPFSFGYYLFLSKDASQIIIEAWPIVVAVVLSIFGGILSLLKKNAYIVTIKNLIKLSMLFGVVFLFL